MENIFIKKPAVKAKIEINVGDNVTYEDDIIDKTEKFKVVEVINNKLHIKMLSEPYASYLVPANSVTKV